MTTPRWSRVLLKLSGEAFAGNAGSGIDGEVVTRLANDIVEVKRRFDVALAVVVGGGNIWRGLTGAGAGMDRTQADYMGMLATAINALALQETLVVEPYVRPKALQYLEEGKVVVFAAGTGNPFFTTDTAAALRAVEIEAEVMLKGTHSGTEGVYSADPKVDPDAELLTEVSYLDVLSQGLKVMDSTATSLCMDNELPIVVFDLMGPGNLAGLLAGERIGTLVS